jgi:hypothetical protein
MTTGWESKSMMISKKVCAKEKKPPKSLTSSTDHVEDNHLKQFMEGLSAKYFVRTTLPRHLQDELQRRERQDEWAFAWKRSWGQQCQSQSRHSL